MYKSRGNKGLFDEEFIKERLSVIGNPLEAIKKVHDFEVFRELLESKLLNTNKKNSAGAQYYDVVMLFKILILQLYYGFVDSQVEYQILDRSSFKSFLGLAKGDKVPDEKTVWSFRERITKTGLVEELFLHFVSFLEKK
jgi:transposase